MIRRGIPLGRFSGVPVTVGVSWILVVPLVGVALFAGVPARLGPLWGRVVVAGSGTLLMFASVLVHEMGHVLVATRRGVVVERVMVFLFGGYSEMDLDGADPVDDAAISVAGPVASAMLAFATLLVALAVPEWAGARRTLALLGLVNVGVALFNLLPGFPLDGGRIVRATLISAGMARRDAEVVTARLGIGLGVAAIAAGVWMSQRGEVGSIVAVPVGVLVVVIAAAAHPRRVQRAGDLMRVPGDPVSETDPVASVGERPGEGPVPVVTAGRVVGFVARDARGLLVGEAMVPTSPLDVVAVGDPATQVLDRVSTTGRPAAVTHRGRLVGVVDPPVQADHPPTTENEET